MAHGIKSYSAYNRELDATAEIPFGHADPLHDVAPERPIADQSGPAAVRKAVFAESRRLDREIDRLQEERRLLLMSAAIGSNPIKRRRTLKAAMIALVVALVAIVTTSTITWKQRIITAIVAAAIAVAVSLFVPGCMSTTSIDGKEYSWRLDILAPIGATVPKPEWETPAPIVIYTTTQPAAQPAAQPAR